MNRKRKLSSVECSLAQSDSSSEVEPNTSDDNNACGSNSETGQKVLPATSGPGSKRILPACSCTPYCLVSTTSDAGSSNLTHVDLTEDVSFDESYATTSALRTVAKKEQKFFCHSMGNYTGEESVQKVSSYHLL